MRNGFIHRARRTILVGLAILFVALLPVYAQSVTATHLNQRVTLDADDAYLPTILAILAEKSGYNIVTGPGVSKTEKLTVKLKDTPIEEAMNLVVRAVGLSYELVGNSFLVAKPEFVKADVGLTSYVIQLKYADPEAVKNLLSKTKATVEVDKSSGNLIIIASPKVMAECRKIVESIDIPSLQIMLSARVIEVAVEDEERIGVDWGRLSPVEFKMAEGAGTSMKIDRFDNLGVFYRQQPIFDFAMDWLLKNNKAEVLANSQVATINGQSASLKVVNVFKYLYSTTESQFNPQQVTAVSTVPTLTLGTEEVGVKLSITPKVSIDGYITTTITSEVSSIYGYIGKNLDIPLVFKREATTTIRVRDGQSIVIGGLLGIDRKIIHHKVPFLGDVPYFGGLFRHSYESVRKTDMIIEVTPTILKDSTRFHISERILKAAEDLNRPSESHIEQVAPPPTEEGTLKPDIERDVDINRLKEATEPAK